MLLLVASQNRVQCGEDHLRNMKDRITDGTFQRIQDGKQNCRDQGGLCTCVVLLEDKQLLGRVVV
jgi:hypothetical protein